jgi:hypothetical protein
MRPSLLSCTSAGSATTERGSPVAGFELVGGGASRQRVEDQPVLERGEGAARSVGAVARSARQADADLSPFEVDPVTPSV